MTPEIEVLKDGIKIGYRVLFLAALMALGSYVAYIVAPIQKDVKLLKAEHIKYEHTIKEHMIWHKRLKL